MKSLLLLAPLACSASIFTNPPVLIDGRDAPLVYPVGEMAPLTGPGYRVSSPDSPSIFSLGDSIAGFDGPLLVEHAGYVGVTVSVTDIAGWPMPGVVQVIVNGKLVKTVTEGYVGTDEPGAVLLQPLEGYATITTMTVAPPAPSITAAIASGRPVARLQGLPGQTYALNASDSPKGPWKRWVTGKLDGGGKAEVEVEAGKFYRSE